MSDRTIRPGDIVVLASEGPYMTVASILYDEIEGRTKVSCSWFDGERVLHKGTFYQEMLERVERRTSAREAAQL